MFFFSKETSLDIPQSFSPATIRQFSIVDETKTPIVEPNARKAGLVEFSPTHRKERIGGEI